MNKIILEHQKNIIKQPPLKISKREFYGFLQTSPSQNLQAPSPTQASAGMRTL